MITVASKNVLKKAHLSDFFWVPYSALWYQRKSDKYALRGYNMITVASKIVLKKVHLLSVIFNMKPMTWETMKHLLYTRKSTGFPIILISSKRV